MFDPLNVVVEIAAEYKRHKLEEGAEKKTSTAELVATIISWVLCIGLAIGAVIIDLFRNPMKHPKQYIRYRTGNWIIIGLSYAFAYMGKYNISCANIPAIHARYKVTSEEYGVIITCGTVAYAVALLINGFLCDIIGSKFACVFGTIGSGVMNILSGIIMNYGNLEGKGFIASTAIFFMVSNYFQTFVTCAMVKVGACWYHRKERGFFSGVFGIIISFGFFLAFQVDGLFVNNDLLPLAFIVPGVVLIIFGVLTIVRVKTNPEEKFPPSMLVTLKDEESIDAINARAAQEAANANNGEEVPLANQQSEDHSKADVCEEPDVVEGSAPLESENNDAEILDKDVDYSGQQKTDMSDSVQHIKRDCFGRVKGEKREKIHMGAILKPIFTQPIFYLLAVIEICLGWSRDGVLNYYSDLFATIFNLDKQSVPYTIASTGVTIGGMFGGLITGSLSDSCFKARRQPVAMLDFALLIIGNIALLLSIYFKEPYCTAICVTYDSIWFNGINGILTNVMSMDFAGRGSVGTAVGVLDCVQKIGSAITGVVTPKIIKSLDGKMGYVAWAGTFIPFCLLAMILFSFILNRKPGSKEKICNCSRAKKNYTAMI